MCYASVNIHSDEKLFPNNEIQNLNDRVPLLYEGVNYSCAIFRISNCEIKITIALIIYFIHRPHAVHSATNYTLTVIVKLFVYRPKYTCTHIMVVVCVWNLHVRKCHACPKRLILFTWANCQWVWCTWTVWVGMPAPCLCNSAYITVNIHDPWMLAYFAAAKNTSIYLRTTQ